ncbi:MAG: efflux RND transporter permease subunit, partial [Ostreibacterium sp.]
MSKLPTDKHPIINWFISNPVAANLLTIGILLSGLYMVGYFGLFGQKAKLRLEAFPSRETNTVLISASINGSTPEDVEKGVTNKIEEALQSIQGIDKTTSISTAYSATVYITSVTDYNMDKLLNDIKTQVDAINNLPKEVEQVLVTKATQQSSILWVTLHGSANDKTLKIEANRLKDRLLQNPFIEKVDIDAEKSAEIVIEIPRNTLKEYGLTFNQIATAINNGSLDLSSGSIETKQGTINLRIKAQAYRQSDYENIIIRAGSDGSSIRLGDIALVKDGFKEQKIYSGFNGQPSLTLRLQSGRNSNVIEADKAANSIIKQFKQTLPSNITATTWNNRVTNVRDRINLFIRNSLMGVALVFLLLTLFLNTRLAFWVALGIPICFAGALLIMKVFDISINLISLFGFILVLGIIVDDAIVIGESVYSWKKRTNNAPDATIRGVSRVSTAATFGVLTTIAAFLPLTQITGGMGDILGQLGAVVIFCLIFSLIESKLILPAHLAHISIASDRHQAKNLWTKLQTNIANSLETFIEKIYSPLLSAALRQRYFSLLLFIALFILAIGTVLGGFLKVSFMPRIEARYISLKVEMDPKVSVEDTIAQAKKATKALRIADKKLMQQYGENSPNITHISTFNTSDTQFMIFAGLAGAETRTIGASIIANKWRQVTGKIPESESVNYEYSQRFSATDIEIQLLGDDDTKQQTASDKLISALTNIKGVKDIASNQDEATSEIRIAMKPEAAAYGITKEQLAQTIRAAFYGLEAERVQRGDEESRVIVRAPKSERKSLSDLYQLQVHLSDGSSLPIVS